LEKVLQVFEMPLNFYSKLLRPVCAEVVFVVLSVFCQLWSSWMRWLRALFCTCWWAQPTRSWSTLHLIWWRWELISWLLLPVSMTN